MSPEPCPLPLHACSHGVGWFPHLQKVPQAGSMLYTRQIGVGPWLQKALLRSLDCCWGPNCLRCSISAQQAGSQRKCTDLHLEVVSHQMQEAASAPLSSAWHWAVWRELGPPFPHQVACPRTKVQALL